MPVAVEFGEVAEWPIVQHWKCCVRETVPGVRIPPSPLKDPGFPRVFRISAQLLWLSCTSMHVHACTYCVVWCAALVPGESSESPLNPRFSTENGGFAVEVAGFELASRIRRTSQPNGGFLPTLGRPRVVAFTSCLSL